MTTEVASLAVEVIGGTRNERSAVISKIAMIKIVDTIVVIIFV